MLQYAAIQAVCKYPLDTLVHITCRNMAFASLIEALFPDQEPYVVRHGEVSGVDQSLAELADTLYTAGQSQKETGEDFADQE